MTDPTTQAAATSGPADRGLGLLYLTGGLLGLVAAVVLLVESIALLKNPDYVPTCSINPILSCGSVMNTPQAAAFGIPNPIIGVAGFAALSMFAVVVLTGATIRPWLWTATQASVTFAVLFIHWLIYQSLYVIGALCPYCMLVWVVTIAVFWHTTIHTLQRSKRSPRRRGIVDVLNDYRGTVLTGWYLVIVVLIAQRFWTYWMTVV
ncbi:vitamin K epoxide reductase family protein [Janibacter cremeus]|uniref:vitamin K epoxide reductase family protein n=1 Tax=Janibacter cremeus TaxID=1285192 RepID=UPI0023F9A76A|nr:vitamin K epoxide reductase family protein [Janibacter cremeus]WEV78928.1 vitamin K epoxide reductase family protein [Janibacter cremeus]